MPLNYPGSVITKHAISPTTRDQALLGECLLLVQAASFLVENDPVAIKSLKSQLTGEKMLLEELFISCLLLPKLRDHCKRRKETIVGAGHGEER